MAAPRTILVLAFPYAQLLDISGPLQMFARANHEFSVEAYRIRMVAPEAGHFATSSGIRPVAVFSFAEVTHDELACTHALIASGGSEGVRIEPQHGVITQIVANAVHSPTNRAYAFCRIVQPRRPSRSPKCTQVDSTLTK
jgi:transcriptional regulator GlxA family with amidase domain